MAFSFTRPAPELAHEASSRNGAETREIDTRPISRTEPPTIEHTLDPEIGEDEELVYGPIHWPTPTGENALVILVRDISISSSDERTTIRACVAGKVYHVYELIHPRGARIGSFDRDAELVVTYEGRDRQRRVVMSWDPERRCPVAIRE